MSRRVPPPELFIDRSLGRKHLPEALRACDLVVHTLSSVYGEDAGQQVADVRWLGDAGRNDWIVLMKDDAIRRRPAERDALTEGWSLERVQDGWCALLDGWLATPPAR